MTWELASSTPLCKEIPVRMTFERVYEAEYVRLVNVARLTTGSKELAEELVQDAFADLYRRFDGVENPSAYMRRAVMSRCTSWVRRRVLERRHAAVLAPDPAWTDPDPSGVVTAVAGLPRRQRAAVVLRYFADWPEQDIADALGCRPGTVKSLLSRARQTLEGELGEDH